MTPDTAIYETYDHVALNCNKNTVYQKSYLYNIPLKFATKLSALSFAVSEIKLVDSFLSNRNFKFSAKAEIFPP